MYIVPFVFNPPIPSLPYFVLSSIPFKSISFVMSDRLILDAIIAGSKAWIFILLGLDAKLAPALINSS